MNRLRVGIIGDKELIRKLVQLPEGASDVLADALLAGGHVVRDDANRRAPGPHIVAQIASRARGRAEVVVGPDKEHWYYRFAETGAQPHTYGPKTAQALVFLGDRGLVVTGRVAHPGMAARPFLRPALDERGSEAADAAGQMLRQRLESR